MAGLTGSIAGIGELVKTVAGDGPRPGGNPPAQPRRSVPQVG